MAYARAKEARAYTEEQIRRLVGSQAHERWRSTHPGRWAANQGLQPREAGRGREPLRGAGLTSRERVLTFGYPE